MRTRTDSGLRAGPVLGLLVLLAGLLTAGHGATTTSGTVTRAEEALRNEVTVVFYLMSKSTFAEKRDQFRRTMADAANSQCRASHSLCGFSSDWHQTETFSITDVEISSESDSVEKARLHVKYFVSLPRSLSNTKTKYILNKDAVAFSVANERELFYKHVGYSVVQAGTSKLSPIPDVTVNSIMIVLAFVVTLALIIILVACRKYRKKQQHVTDRNVKIDQYKKTHPLREPIEKRQKPLGDDSKDKSANIYRRSEPDLRTTNIRSDQNDFRSQHVNMPVPRGQPEPHITHSSPPYSKEEPVPAPPLYDYRHHADYADREPYSRPHMKTVHVSSYDRPAPDLTAANDYYNPGNAPAGDRANALAPLTPDELRKQRKLEKKARKQRKRAEEAATGGMGGARSEVSTPAGYENSSYDNSETRRLSGSLSSEKRYNIPVRPQPDSRYTDTVSRDSALENSVGAEGRITMPARYRELDSETSDSGMNSNHSRSLTSAGLYRSTDV